MSIEGKLLGPDGQPISSEQFRPQNKKGTPPKLGTSFGDWAGRDQRFMTLPGGGVVQFDLSKLNLSDFRAMRDHYQINSSLAVLSFMQHQSDFHVECDDQKIANFCDEQLHEVWTPLNRAMSTATWAGYSPTVIEWDNDYNGNSVVISKIKDLAPEECWVNWKLEEGWAPPGRIKPKFKKFDGIQQWGAGWPVPVENSFWFSLLMENGNYYGRKLLRPAFQSWFFSILLHLFANRYYERFGEPVPIGRAPFDEPIEVGTESIPGNDYMLSILQAIRSRAAVVLPNSRTEDKNGKQSFDYEIEYLESQMRGADFERYMTRLDEEMSLALFTPILLFRTADVGSYNLGTGHMQMWLWMLNSMNGDRKAYIDPYILSPMVDYNFSTKAPRAKIIFHKQGNITTDVIQALIAALVRTKMVLPDLKQLGELTGMTWKEVDQTLAPPTVPDPAADPNKGTGNDGAGGGTPAPAKTAKDREMAEVFNVASEIESRIRGQIEGAYRDDRVGTDLQLNMGFKNKMARALSDAGVRDSIGVTTGLYRRLDMWLGDVTEGRVFTGPDTFMDSFSRVLVNEITSIPDAS